MSDRRYIPCKHCNKTGVEPGKVITSANGYWLCACCNGRGWVTLQRETMFNRLGGASRGQTYVRGMEND